MKNIIFLVAILFFTAKTNAQNNLYHVEDPWFLSYLQANYPQTIVNDSLDIDATAGIDTLDLPFTATSFTNIDPVQFFNDLTYLNCWGHDITSLPELPDGLKVLRCASNELTSLPELPNGLIWLSCGTNQLTSLPELPDGLVLLTCNQNDLTSLPLLPQNLSVITFFGNPLECVSNHLPQFPELNTYPICYGCTDPLYLEYEALAADDDGSCATIISVGCMDANADNFDEFANVSGACDYSCPLTANGTSYLDGLCYDYVWTYGYTVEELEGIGYDCSCVENPFYGCMDSAACNYDALATNAGSCTYTDGICETCEDGIIIDNDTDNDGICDADEVVGCQDMTACNYNGDATDEDGSCEYIDGICDWCDTATGTIIDNDSDDDGICDDDEIETYNCINAACIDPGDNTGTYTSLADCEADCTPLPSWDCVTGGCVDPADGSGLYSALEDCEAACVTSAITDPNKAYKKLKKIINLLGQETPLRKNTPMFYIYDDGTVEKKVIIE